MYLRSGTIDFIKEEGIYPDFDSWQDGYGAFSVSQRDKDQLINYIKNQEEHHKKKTFKEPLRILKGFFC